MSRYWSAGQIIRQAALEVGLQPAADPYQSQDPKDQQLVGLLATTGLDLALQHAWPQITLEHTFVTTPGVTNYALPGDFLELVGQSGWSRTSRFPLGGPLSPQEWQYLKAAQVGVSVTALFRVRGGEDDAGNHQDQISLQPLPSAAETIAFEYRSRNWAQNVVSKARLDAPAQASDLVLFDPLLAVRALKLAFLRAKGFDTTAAQADYDDTLERVRGAMESAPRLSLTGSGAIRERALNSANLPNTGFGS